MTAMLANTQAKLGNETWAIDAGLALIGASATVQAGRTLTAMIRSRRNTTN